MVDCVFQWVIQFNGKHFLGFNFGCQKYQLHFKIIHVKHSFFPTVSVQPVSQVVDVKLILMNVLHLLVTTVELVPIYHKVTDVNVHLDTLVKIVKKKKVAAKRTHVQHELCAKMNQVLAITHASAEVVTLEQTAM